MKKRNNVLCFSQFILLMVPFLDTQESTISQIQPIERDMFLCPTKGDDCAVQHSHQKENCSWPASQLPSRDHTERPLRLHLLSTSGIAAARNRNLYSWEWGQTRRSSEPTPFTSLYYRQLHGRYQSTWVRTTRLYSGFSPRVVRFCCILLDPSADSSPHTASGWTTNFSICHSNSKHNLKTATVYILSHYDTV